MGMRDTNSESWILDGVNGHWIEKIDNIMRMDTGWAIKMPFGKDILCRWSTN